MKKNFLLLVLMVAVIASGCIFKRHKPAPATSESKAIVKPQPAADAKVVSYNAVGRFVVLNFPSGQMPKLQQTFSIYRDGVKVAEIRISGPQEGNNIVADILTGEAQPGDEVRAQ